MDIGQIAYAIGEVARGSVVRHFHMPSGLVCVEKHKHIGRAIAPVFAIVTLRLTCAAGIGSRTSPINCVGLLLKQTTGRPGSDFSA
jgi:hypothetical protein